MRTLASLALLCLMATTAQATPLKLVHVSAKAVYRTFDTDGRIAVRDFTDDFVWPGTIGKGILLSRRFPRGQPGTTGAGRYAYLYRLDLRELVKDTARPCVDALRLDFGPVVPLDYTGDGTPDEVFVIALGNQGKVAPTAADQVGDTITFRFKSPICAAQVTGGGDFSLLFGLASVHPTTEVRALLRTTLDKKPALVAKAPRLPIDVDCNAGQSLANAVSQARPGDIIHVTGTCLENITISTHQVAVVGIGPTVIVGERTRPVVTIDSRQGVVLKNLTLRGGFTGVVAKGLGRTILAEIHAEQNTLDGFQFDDRARVQCADCSASDNGNNGFLVRNHAATTFFGKTQSQFNMGHGTQVSDASLDFDGNDVMFLATSSCHPNGVNNRRDGVLVERVGPNGPNKSFNLTAGCVFTARSNGRDGIRFIGVTLSFVREATMRLWCNHRSGMSAWDNSTVSIEGSTIGALKNGHHGIELGGMAAVAIDFDEFWFSTTNSQICSRNNTRAGLRVSPVSGAAFMCDSGAVPQAEVRLRPMQPVGSASKCQSSAALSCPLPTCVAP